MEADGISFETGIWWIARFNASRGTDSIFHRNPPKHCAKRKRGLFRGVRDRCASTDLLLFSILRQHALIGDLGHGVSPGARYAYQSICTIHTQKGINLFRGIFCSKMVYNLRTRLYRAKSVWTEGDISFCVRIRMSTQILNLFIPPARMIILINMWLSITVHVQQPPAKRRAPLTNFI